MKKNRIMALCVILLLLISLCVGCTKPIGRFEDEELRQYTETILDAIIAEDFQTAYEPFRQICLEDDFFEVFSQMRSLIGYANAYELKLLSINTNVSWDDGQQISSKDAIYQMTAGKKIIIVSIGTDSQRGLRGFTLAPYQSTDYYSVGTLSNMQGANWTQVLLLLSNLIPLGLVIFAIVDCIRSKLKNKALWILLLILGFATLGMTTAASGIKLNFHLAGLSGYSALIFYGSGTTAIRLMVPVGAFIYFIRRLSQVKSDPISLADEEENAKPAETQE